MQHDHGAADMGLAVVDAHGAADKGLAVFVLALGLYMRLRRLCQHHPAPDASQNPAPGPHDQSVYASTAQSQHLLTCHDAALTEQTSVGVAVPVPRNS